MLKRKTLIRVAFGVVAAAVLAVPSLVSAAPSMAPVSIAHTVDTSNGNCTITLDGAWNETITKGPKLNVQLFESKDGAAPVLIGFHQRVADDGSDIFARSNRVEGEYTYEFRLTKGPKHMIGTGSTTVSCAP